MKKVLGALLALLAVVVLVGVGVVVFSNTSLGPVSDAAQGAKAAVANAAMDATDLKGQVKNAIDERKDDIAAATGLTADQVDALVAELDIDGWQAAALPADAVETGTVTGRTPASTAPSPPTTTRATSPSRPMARTSPSPSPRARRRTCRTWHSRSRCLWMPARQGDGDDVSFPDAVRPCETPGMRHHPRPPVSPLRRARLLQAALVGAHDLREREAYDEVDERHDAEDGEYLHR